MIEPAGMQQTPPHCVSPIEQKRCHESRVNGGPRFWKFSAMDHLAYSRRYHNSRARDQLFQAAETLCAGRCLKDSGGQKQPRCNLISRRLEQLFCSVILRGGVKLPNRQERSDSRKLRRRFRVVRGIPPFFAWPVAP